MNGLKNLSERVMIDRGDMSEVKYSRQEMGMTSSTIRLMRNEKSVSLRTVQKFADTIEMPGPIVFTDPYNEVPEELYSADFSFIPVNIERIREKEGISIEMLAEKSGLSNRRVRNIELGVSLCNTEELQHIADILDVDITELMIRPRFEYIDGEPISHKNYVPINTRIIVNKVKLHNKILALSIHTIEKITSGKDLVMIDKLEDIAIKAGIGLADLFVHPGIETEWYRETKSEYLTQNFCKELVERDMSILDVSAASSLDRGTVAKVEAGFITTIRTVQAIADAFKMEIGDLFLPPKG